MDELLNWPTVQVRHGSRLRSLPTGTPVEVETEVLGHLETIETFMERFGVSSFVVIKDGSIRTERYQYGHRPSSRQNVESITKSFLSTAIAIAVQEGHIVSIDDPITKYLQEMEGTAFGRGTIRDLLDMTAGARDPSEATRRAYYYDTTPETVMNWLKSFEVEGDPGTTYRYSDQSYYLASRVLERAVAAPVEEYLAQKIWEPAGMQHDAYIRQTNAGKTDGHGGMSMTALDLARFGLFILDSFHDAGGPDVPVGWFQRIAAAGANTGIRAPGALDFLTQDYGYELGWWTLPRGRSEYELGDDGGFAAIGYFGQALFVIPALNAVVSMQSAATIEAPERHFAQKQLVTAIVKALKSE